MRELGESSNQTVPELSTGIPEICVPQLAPGWQFGAGTAYWLTPLLVPGLAWASVRLPIAPSQPSVHQAWPRLSRAIRCGVPTFLAFVRYSRMSPVFKAPACGGTKLPIWATERLFSVNHIAPVLLSGPTMP